MRLQRMSLIDRRETDQGAAVPCLSSPSFQPFPRGRRRCSLDIGLRADQARADRVELIIVIAKECWLSTVSPLSDVMRKIRFDHTGEAGQIERPSRP